VRRYHTEDGASPRLAALSPQSRRMGAEATATARAAASSGLLRSARDWRRGRLTSHVSIAEREAFGAQQDVVPCRRRQHSPLARALTIGPRRWPARVHRTVGACRCIGGAAGRGADEERLAAADPVAQQDVFYVGRGNTVHLLALWRAHGLDVLLVKAWLSGALLCGISAGMLCWFEAMLTDSFGELGPVMDGLGLLAGSACPHYDGEHRRRRFVANEMCT
jgi:hypothetical protein